MDTIFGPAQKFPSSIEELQTLYDYAWSHKDERVEDWFLMSSPAYVLGIILAYLVLVLFCKRWVMRLLYSVAFVQYLHLYNMILLTVNGVMGSLLLWHVYHVGYNWRCQPVSRDHGDHEMSIARLIWFFFLSKIIELFDSVWLILKKKGAPLTFLQVYHHSTIVFACFIGARFVPGGSTALIAMINCWVHVLMYSYFKVKSKVKSGMREIVPYKKFVTIMQMLQFLATIIHCITAMCSNCNYPRFILFWLMLYMFTFVVLFTHFYCYTYYPASPRSPRPSVSGKKATTSTSVKAKSKRHNHYHGN